MVSEQKILNLVRLHQPIKAREIAQILTKEFNQHTDRSDVNSILYRMKKENKVVINKNYEWSLAEKMLDSVQESSISTPVSKAEITFTPEQESIINLDPTEHLLIRGQAGSGKTTVLAARAGKILSAMNKGSLLFLTYNSSLCAYVKKHLKKRVWMEILMFIHFMIGQNRVRNLWELIFQIGWIVKSDRKS